MVKDSTGGAKTKTGLVFKKKINLTDRLNNLSNFKIVKNKIYKNKKLLGYLFPQNNFYNFLKEQKIDWKSKISAKLKPDDALYVLNSNTVFILEYKFQQVSGSTDEKLQTCDFKKKQYEKLFKGTGIKVEYLYVLNSWFKHDRYKDVLKYIQDMKCYYFFNEVPLEFLGL